ncbi:hypothetical protein GT042_02150, partial [Streptomyces sp. SID3212]|nr:hypothetical protein [Streptomyces sp. SID3212]
ATPPISDGPAYGVPATARADATADGRLEGVLEALRRGELSVDEVDRLMTTSENGSHV